MECLNTSRSLSRYVDGQLSAAERGYIERHLTRCRPCFDQAEDLRQIRRAMGTMPRRVPSEHVQMALKVLASRERFRRMSRLSFEQRFERWRERVTLSLTEMMRPLMLPVAGGFLSATLLFGMLAPDITVYARPALNDIPAPALYTEASMNYLVYLPVQDAEIEIDVHVDDSGRMTDYHVVSGGETLLRDGRLRRRLESTLLVTQFVPATTFGQPTYGRVRVRVVRDEVDVRG